MTDLHKIKESYERELKSAQTIEEVEQLRIKYLGRQGVINELTKDIRNVAQEEKKEFGSKLNELKQNIEKQLEDKGRELAKKSEQEQSVDVTLPGTTYPKGSLHIVTYAIEEITRIFEKIGFIRMSYPEVEWEYYAFDSLNMPPDHPARDDFETFFIDVQPHEKYGKMVLTPHTSSGQNREMKRLGKPPVRMINIAKCYRPNWSPAHVPMFHQFEGLCVDENINITHLKGTIDYFAKEFFGENREIRLRPFHFQFTEPSFEVDVTCGVCLGTGYVPQTDSVENSKTESVKVKCKLCKSGWLELGGAGMVHPNALKEGGVDPEVYTGWAFGFGVERVMMMKEGLKLDDIRTLYNGDVRFLGQF